MRFSETHGFRPMRSALQIDSIDPPLRNALWNALLGHVLSTMATDDWGIGWTPARHFAASIWQEHYLLRLDHLPENPHLFVHRVWTNTFENKWYEIYDLLQFVLEHWPPQLPNARKSAFREACNRALEQQMSVWRLVGDQVARLTAEEEIAAVEGVENMVGPYEPVARHIRSAVAKLSDRKTPDYPNSMKESISAVEAVCQIISEDPKATLGRSLDKLAKGGLLRHQAALEAFNKLYAYTSDADGIRHATIDMSTVDFEDAKFMLVACSAFVNFLKARADETV